MTLTRRYRFSASHRLHSPALSEDANQHVYGRCNNPYGHGHNYVLEVSVSGSVDSKTGRVAALGDLDAIVSHHVLSIYDGRHMNLDIDTFQHGLVPTTENVAMDIRRRLEAQWPPHGPAWRNTPNPPRLSGIRLYETRKNIFDH